jgi:hypothetical protein
MRAALLSRINNYYIVEDWTVVIAFFHPATKRNAVPEAILTVVADFVNEYGEATVHPLEGARGPGVRDVMGDFNEATIRRPPARSTEDEHTIFSYLKYWTAAKVPRLTAFLRVLAELPPTEADVERAFSKLKRMVPRLRSCLAPERVASSLILMSALDGEDEEQDALFGTDEGPVSAAAALTIMELYAEAHGPQRPERGKETRSRTMTCIMCNKHLNEHTNPDAFTCKGCSHRCACECSEVHPARWNEAHLPMPRVRDGLESWRK